MDLPLKLAATLLLAGCAAYDGSTLGRGATEDEVRRAMGPPALVLPNPDGSRLLAYPRGPLGTQTFMVEMDRDGRLRQIRRALGDDTFHRIRPGMTRDEVLRLIGPPFETGEFPRLGQVAWDYRFVDTWGYTAIFSVMFDRKGVVVSKFTRRIEREDGFFR
jgi:outer membrane protein assembly factor BamE (lipoprotein component of BamABCDE complex)